jgi:NADP-dependent 3-hydroxy acid dehydrogenase YdfG
MSGIGLASARLLINAGAHVLVTGRTKGALDCAREELGKNAIVIESDAASLADIDAADRVKSEFETFEPTVCERRCYAFRTVLRA